MKHSRLREIKLIISSYAASQLPEELKLAEQLFACSSPAHCALMEFQCIEPPEKIVRNEGNTRMVTRTEPSADRCWVVKGRKGNWSFKYYPITLYYFHILPILRKDFEIFLMHSIQPLLRRFVLSLSQGHALAFLMNNWGDSDMDSRATMLQKVLIYGA